MRAASWPLLLVAASTLLLLHLLTLMRIPAPFVDEAWLAARAWEFEQSGRPFGVLDAGVLDRYEGYWTYFPWLPTFFQSLGIRALGLSLFSVRLVSLVFGAALVAILYALGHRLAGRRTAALAAVLVSLSPAFLEASHMARHDVIAATLGFGAVLLHLADGRGGRSILCVLSGLTVGLAFEVHPNAAIYGVAIAALYFVDYGFMALRSGRFWGFAAGAAVGLSVYVALHLLPYPRTYAAITALMLGPSYTPPLLSLDPSLWLRAVLDTARLLVESNHARAPLVAAALAFLVWRRSAAGTRLGVLFVALFLGMALLVRTKHSYYAIFVTPAADLAVAYCVAELSRAAWSISPWAPLWRSLRTAAVWGLVFAAAAATLIPGLRDPMADFQTTVQRLGAAAPPGSSIMSSQTYWFGLRDRSVVSWQQLALYRHDVPGSVLADAFEALRPDYFVVDRHMEMFVTAEKERAYRYADLGLHLPKLELEGFLGKRGSLVGVVDTPTFPSVRIYRIRW